eukprot:IDg23497t1
MAFARAVMAAFAALACLAGVASAMDAPTTEFGYRDLVARGIVGGGAVGGEREERGAADCTGKAEPAAVPGDAVRDGRRAADGSRMRVLRLAVPAALCARRAAEQCGRARSPHGDAPAVDGARVRPAARVEELARRDGRVREVRRGAHRHHEDGVCARAPVPPCAVPTPSVPPLPQVRVAEKAVQASVSLGRVRPLALSDSPPASPPRRHYHRAAGAFLQRLPVRRFFALLQLRGPGPVPQVERYGKQEAVVAR